MFIFTPQDYRQENQLFIIFLENWEISNNELNVLKLEFEVNIMDNKTSHNSSSI
jgi:hypothetical protein